MREYSLKSPGVKTASTRHSNSTIKGDKNPVSSSPSPVRDLHEDQPAVADVEQPPSMVEASPPSLSPPNSPPHDSVFVPVFIPTPSKFRQATQCHCPVYSRGTSGLL